MHCHVLLTGFAWPKDEAAQVCSGLAPVALQTLIAKGRRSGSRHEVEANAPEAWLMSRFGVERQRDWPAGPYSLLGDDGAPGESVWMRADPVHLRIDDNRLVLADHALMRIARDEAEALAESINRHLGDRIVVHPLRPQRWYARLDRCPDIETTPLSVVRGRAVDARLPRGAEAIQWHALANELQMLLHDHPVNAARESRGEQAVNGVWFWGAGTLRSVSARPFRHVAADDPLALGLAKSSGARVSPLPQDAGAWLASVHELRVALAVLDALSAAARYGLARLERDWFAPLLHALRAGRVGMLTLHLIGEEGLLDVETARSDLRHFWRRARPIEYWLG